jgi:stage II sporulation protein M
VFRRLKTDIIQHIRKNITLYLIILFALLTGIASGSFTAGAMDDVQRNALGRYLQTFFQSTKYEPVNRTAILLESLWQHLQSTFVIWLSGLFLFGMPLVFLFVGIRSFYIGFTIGFLISQYHFGGLLFIVVCILPQTLIYIPCITGIERLKTRKTMLSREQRNRNAGNYTLKIMVLFALLAAGSMLEAYLSPVFFGLFRWVFD